jgi:hypothetical protein
MLPPLCKESAPAFAGAIAVSMVISPLLASPILRVPVVVTVSNSAELNASTPGFSLPPRLIAVPFSNWRRVTVEAPPSMVELVSVI